MLAIPAIDLMEGRCVRLLRGDYGHRMEYSPDPGEQARRFQDAGFQRLHVIDLEGARLGTGANRAAIGRIVRSCRIPVQVGGGIRTEDDVRELLDYGVSWLILGTSAVDEPERVESWLERWGAGRFLVSLDLRGNRVQTAGWLQESRRTVAELLDRVERWGIPELICTDVERDGTLDQPNYATYRRLAQRLGDRVGVLAAGGVSRPEHLLRLQEAGAVGAVIGRALYEGEHAWEEFLLAG